VSENIQVCIVLYIQAVFLQR